MKSISTTFSNACITTFSLIILLFSANTVFSQTVFEDWMQTRGSQNYFLKSTVKTDANRNVYQAGATISSAGDYDVIVTKYNPRGEEIWTQTYDVAGYDDAAVDLFIDDNSNVYLAGTTFNPSNSGYQVLVLKYNSSGTFLWDDVYAYPNSLYNLATSITGHGNSIYIGGATYNITNQADYLALSYTATGTMIWNYSWNNVSYNDVITKIHLAGNTLSLAGGTQIDSDKWEYGIVNLDASTGNFQMQKISGGSGAGIDKITDLARDNAGNIYVTGGAVNSNTGYDFRTLKLDSDLNITWSASYNSSGNYNDVANALAVDPAGNVYVTGYSESADQGTNYTTLKYNASGGQVWAASYNGNAADTAKAIILDQYNQPIITGVSENTANEDFHTVKYNANGNEIWNIRYNGVSNGNDNPFDIAIDSSGDIIIAGQSEIGGSYRYTSVKYIERHIVNPPDEEKIPSSGYFTRNNGQLINTGGQSASEVKFIAGADYPKVYVQDDKLSYVFHVADSLASDTVHRIDMIFNERKKNSKIRALDKMDFYQNYYLPTVADGKRERVESFKKLISLDVWDDIDLLISHNNKGLKYYLICKPGFNTADLGWKYGGAASVTINASGELVLSSSIGSVIMPKGEAYEVNSSGTRIDKTWQPTFSVSGNNVSLGIGAFNPNNTLIIEIDKGVVQGTEGTATIGNMLWNSYYGGASFSYFNDVDTDTNGNIFILGESQTGNFPLSSGQVVVGDYSGGRDVIVLMLNEDVEPQWLTYFGGSDNAITGKSKEIAESIKVFESIDSAKQIFICGYTNSDNMTIEDNNGAYIVDNIHECDDVYCQDGFVAQFNEDGTLEWSTYYGGSKRERLYGIDVDELGNIYTVGLHEAGAPMVVKPSADNYVEGEGLILQFASGNRELVWATSWDASIVTSVTIDNDNNIYTTGLTTSAQMPVVNYDSNYPVTSSLSATQSGFVNKFTADGQLDFSFYLAQGGGLGTSIVIDNNNVLNVGGHYGSSDAGLPLIGGFPYFATDRNFVVKINASGTVPQLTHSTFFRGRYNNYEISFPEFLFQSMRLKMDVDNNGNLFLFGCTNDNIPAIHQPVTQPPGFYVKSNLTSIPANPINYNDNYIAAFDTDLNLKWSTYHGSNLEEYSGGITYSHNQQRIVVVGTGWSGGVNGHVYDPLTFEATQYDDSFGSTDYYQYAIGTENMLNGFGAIFGVEGINSPVSLNENYPESLNLKYWPNPTNDLITIMSRFEMERIEFFDMQGKLINEFTPNGQIFEMNTSKLGSGVYHVKCYSNGNVETFKFIKI